MIKVYDSSLGKYVTVGSNRGDNLYTKSINFNSPELPNYDNDSSIITIDEALTSISEEIKEVKEGVAWVYKNGTIGGGGGGSFQNPTFNVTVNNSTIENNTFITTIGSDIKINFSIKGLSIGKKITLSIIKDGEYLENYQNTTFTVSSKPEEIILKNVSTDSYIMFSGYDNETFTSIESYQLNIKIAELSISGPENISFPYDSLNRTISYNVKSTAGVETRVRFELSIYTQDSLNVAVYRYNAPSFIQSQKDISFNIFDTNLFIDDNGNYLNLSKILLEYNNDSSKIIDGIKINAYAETNQFMNLNPYTTNISIVYPDRITIDMFPFTSISNSIPDELYNENEDMLFTITLRYNEDTNFYMYYKLYQIVDNNEKMIYKSSDYANIPTVNRPNNTSYFSRTNQIYISYDVLLSNGLDVNLPVYVYVKAWDVNYDTADINSIRYNGTEKTKYFKFRLAGENDWAPFNIAFSALDSYESNEYGVYAYWNQKNIPVTTNKRTWDAVLANNNITPNWDYKKYIEYYNCNDAVNGLVKDTNNPNKLRLSSKGYASIKNSDGSYFTPFGKIFNQNSDNNWFLGEDLKNENWTISLLYKSDVQANSDAVILDYTIKDRDNNIKEGIYITTTRAQLKFRNAGGDSNSIVYNIENKLSQNVINQIDIVFEGVTNEKAAAKLKLYVNGVMQSASVNDESYYTFDLLPTELYDTEMNENVPIILGAKRNTDGTYTDFADIDIYRLIFYKKALSHYHVLKNYIQGHYDVYRNSEGKQDIIENKNLRTKNFFNNNGTCILCMNEENNPESYYTYVSGSRLYENLKNTNVLPIVHINVTDDPASFYNISSKRWSEGQVADDKNSDTKKITKKYDCEISITSNGKTIEIKDDGTESYSESPSVQLQGTSTLGFTSKNYQISCGKSNIDDIFGNKKEYLIQPFEEMLPENQWILKADIVDSGHANNAAIGGFINDFLTDECKRNGVDDNSENKYAAELKHTTVGRPCIVFMSYNGASNDNGKLPVYEYKGIYSFNLGRISHFNLGYKVFDGYYKTFTDGINPEEVEIKYENHKVITDNVSFPLAVSSYNIKENPYKNDMVEDGRISPTVCFECIENESTVGSFQQYGREFITKFYDRVYPDNETDGFGVDSLLKIFRITSNLSDCDPNNDLTALDSSLENSYRTRHNKQRNTDGQFLIDKENNIYEDFNYDHISSYVNIDNLSTNDGLLTLLTTPQSQDNELYAGLDWKYASSYYVLACLFGLVDSLGKNLNIRSFDQKRWYTSFYDMDTGLGIDNEGKEIIKNDIYLDKFYQSDDKEGIKVYQNSYSNGGFNTCNSRLWNIIRNLKTVAYNEHRVGYYNENYRSMWDKIRTTILKNPETFINDYYIKHNKNVGEVMFNLDYDVKYINDAISKISGNDIGESSADDNKLVSSISLLHGNRINFIKDWFPKHVYFLDGVFDLGCNDHSLSESSKLLYGEKESTSFCYGFTSEENKISPSTNINSLYNVSSEFARTNNNDRSPKSFFVKSNSPIFLILNNSALAYNRYYLPENEYVEIKFKLASNSNGTFATNHLGNIINLDKIKDFRFSSIKDPNYNLLISFDINNLSTINVNADDDFNIKSLINLNELKANNVKNAQDFKLEANLSNSPKVNYIDISNSDINRLRLHQIDVNNKGGVVEYLDISNTDIAELDLTNQTLLTTFSARDCKKLEKLIFNGCEKLTNIGNIPSEVKTLSFDECNSLKKLNLSNMKYLSDDTFVLGHLENLEEFTYTSGNVTNGKQLTKLNFTGCPNLKKLNLQGFAGDHITLNIRSAKTLREINISNSNISYILWADDSDSTNIKYSKSLVDDNDKVLDFKQCENLSHLNVQRNTSIEYILLPDDNRCEIVILGCDNLKRITGNLGDVNIKAFKGLNNFYFNELCKFDINDTTSNIILDENGDVHFDDNANLTVLSDDDINDDSLTLIKYKSKQLLTHYKFLKDGATVDDAFNETNINISDLYAILRKLRNWKSEAYASDNNPDGYITEFNGTFKNCRNIKTRQINYEHIAGRITNIIPLSDYLIEQKNINIDIFDGYDHLTSLKSTFENCSNINGHITGSNDNIKNSIFKYAPELTYIDNVFAGCGELYINSHVFNGNKKLQTIIQPFSDLSYGSKHAKEYPDVNDTLSLTSSEFPVDLSLLFKDLSSLIEIDKPFYNTNVLYDISKIDEMFKTNLKLKTIHYLLPDEYANGWNDDYPEINSLNLANIFGGCYRAAKDGVLNDARYLNYPTDLDNLYPRHIENLDYAFATSGMDEDQPMLDWDNIDYIFYNLGISLNESTNKYETSLESCSYMFDKLAYVKTGDDDGYYNYTRSSTGTLATFPLNMFTIKYKDGDGIVHDVYFSNLKSCEGLFMRAAFKDELKFPGNIFKYCTCDRLNLSHLLEDTVMTPIKLVNIDDLDENGKKYTCFSNCKLGNINSMFKNCFKGISTSIYFDKEGVHDASAYKNNLYKLDRGGLHGIIPNKFFFNAGQISNMESVFEGCCHLGTKIDLICDDNGNYISGTGDFMARDKSCFYTIKTPELYKLQSLVELPENERDYSILADLVEFNTNTNQYYWSSYGYDGTTFDNEYLNLLNSITLENGTYIEAKHSSLFNYILVEDINNICLDKDGNYVKPNSINDVSVLFNNKQNTLKSLQNDKCFIGFDDRYEVVNNINYLKIYYDADYDIKNANFDTKYLGTNYQLWHCDSSTYLDRGKISESYKHDIDKNITPTRFISNYAYPLDLFRYCSSNCNINSIFKNISRFNNDDKRKKYNDYVYGIIGRIPPRWFGALQNTGEMKSVFENNKGIVPYAQSLDGQFNNDLFIKNASLYNIDKIFAGCMLLGHLSDRLFKNTPIKSISEMCKNGYMPVEYAGNNSGYIDYVQFVNSNTFINNSAIDNISGAFSRDANQNDYNSKDAYLYFDINNDMFTTNKHVNILNASRVFENQLNGINRTFRGGLSDVIDFRTWPYIGTNYSNCYLNTNLKLEDIPKELGGTQKNE